MSTALLTRNDALKSISWTESAVALKEDALLAAALIGRVSSDIEQEEAVAAQKALRGVLKTVEDARKACKEPVLEFSRRIDASAKAFIEELAREEMRIAKVVGDYQTEQLAKARAAEALRQRELAELDRKRQAELAAAQTHDQRDQINTRHDEEAKAVKPAIVPVQSKGQIVREEYVVKRIDSFVLAKARPDLVRKIEFDMIAIKALLNAGERLPGVEAEREVSSTVRAIRLEVLSV
jgi:hypothetical protein